MDDALREAERRGDDERAAALRRRAGLPPAGAEPLLPELRARLDALAAAVREHAAARRRTLWGEGSEAEERAASERVDRLRGALDDLGPVVLDALEWLAATELSRGDPRRVEALRALAGSRHLDEVRHERLARSPDHEVHGPALDRARWSEPPPAWTGEAGRAALAGCGEDVARHLELLAEVDAAASVAVFERHAGSEDRDAAEAALDGLLDAGPAAFEALARVTRGPWSDARLWGHLLELDRERALAVAVERVVDAGAPGAARLEASRQLVREDRARAWSALEAAARRWAPGFDPWRGLVQLDFSRALALAVVAAVGPWPEGDDPEAVGPCQAALDALVRCADSRAEAVLLRERARADRRAAWAAERHRAWERIRAGAWRGGWED